MELGWRIIPLYRVGPDGTCSCRFGKGCKTPGKHPLDLKWSAAGPMSAPDIYATWDMDRAPNIGIVTGDPSGFWVLDIDPGAGGFASFKALMEGREKLSTKRFKTGSGGYHLLFKMVDGFRPKTMSNALKAHGFEGIDVRGVGGQIVAPPSRSNKGDYTVAADGPITEAPDWLLELIPQVTDDVEIELDDDDLLERSEMSESELRTADRYIDAAVAGVVKDLEDLPRPWREGAGWDQGTHRAACRLFELAQQSWSKLTYRDAFALLDGHAPRDDQWGNADIAAKWDSAQNTVGKKALPRPKGESEDDRMGAWGFDEPTVGVTVDIEERPAPAKGEKEPSAPRRKRRMRVKFDSDAAFSEPDEKGKQQFQAFDTALSLKAQVDVANGDDGSLWAHSDGIWTPQPKLIQDSLTLTLKNAYKTTMVSEVTHHVESRSPQMVVGPTPDVINFENGMLHWQTGELKGHDPAQFSTIQLPHRWNPDAECPAFDQFLEDSLEPDTVRLAWEAVAVAIYSGNPIQRAILLHGLPGSGKSVFLDVIAGLLGQENVSRVTLQGLSGRFNAAELYGRAANICADIDATKITETGAFKMIVAGDTVQGERKNKDPFTFKPFATQFFSANEIPGSEDRSGAWTRRFAIIHFPRARRADEKVLSYQDVLLREAEGIIAKAVKILPEVLLRGDYSLIQSAQDEFERKTNYLLQFVEDELEPGELTDETCFVPTGEVRNRYNLWCAEEGYDHPATWKKVTETLTAKGFKASLKRFGGGGPVRGWAGFRLKPRLSVAMASYAEPPEDL